VVVVVVVVVVVIVIPSAVPHQQVEWVYTVLHGLGWLYLSYYPLILPPLPPALALTTEPILRPPMIEEERTGSQVRA